MTLKNKISVIIMVFIGVLIFIFETKNTDIKSLLDQIKSINIIWLGAAVLAIFLSFYFESLIGT